MLEIGYPIRISEISNTPIACAIFKKGNENTLTITQFQTMLRIHALSTNKPNNAAIQTINNRNICHQAKLLKFKFIFILNF